MGKCAFIFPGQGSQYVGMGRDLYEQFPAARQVFDRAGHALALDMAGLCFEGPGEELTKTVNAQPAILTVSVACLSVLEQMGIQPHVTAGHSLGEYTALVAAASLNFDEAVRLVRLRGKYMQEAVPLGVGGMVAVIGLETETVARVCLEVSQSAGVVEAVNLNCPGQVVIAGDNGALSRAVEILKERGAKKCVPLSVSAPFHSSMMKPAGELLAAVLAAARVKNPAIPVVSNVTADYHSNGAEIRRLLIRQLYSPVRWEESVRRMVADGVDLFVEVGPGKVLTGLVRKISRDVQVMNVDDIVSLEKALATIREVS